MCTISSQHDRTWIGYNGALRGGHGACTGLPTPAPVPTPLTPRPPTPIPTPAPPTPVPTPSTSPVRPGAPPGVCPGSGVGCSANSCCPGVPESGDQTFPCPGSDPGWNGCQTVPPTPEPTPPTTPVRPGAPPGVCPGSGVGCSANSCCPGMPESGDQTFPCPGSDLGWN